MCKPQLDRSRRSDAERARSGRDRTWHDVITGVKSWLGIAVIRRPVAHGSSIEEVDSDTSLGDEHEDAILQRMVQRMANRKSNVGLLEEELDDGGDSLTTAPSLASSTRMPKRKVRTAAFGPGLTYAPPSISVDPTHRSELRDGDSLEHLLLRLQLSDVLAIGTTTQVRDAKAGAAAAEGMRRARYEAGLGCKVCSQVFFNCKQLLKHVQKTGHAGGSFMPPTPSLPPDEFGVGAEQRHEKDGSRRERRREVKRKRLQQRHGSTGGGIGKTRRPAGGSRRRHPHPPS